jgi:hypothetical protein
MRFVNLRTWVALVVLAAGLALLGAASADEKDDEGFVALFNGKDFTGWKLILEDKAKDQDPAKTFMIEEGVIVVTGKPNGYFYTEKSYKDYILRYDWQYKRPAGLANEKDFKGNSGLLVHIQEPHKVWPKCIEVQGMNLQHGKIFPISGAKGEFKFDEAAHEKAVKPVGEWNTTEVICNDGEITSKVNGVEVSKGKGEFTEGPFGLQSEGAEIHFRNIKIKEAK